jgi:hypothetical protein
MITTDDRLRQRWRLDTLNSRTDKHEVASQKRYRQIHLLSRGRWIVSPCATSEKSGSVVPGILGSRVIGACSPPDKLTALDEWDTLLSNTTSSHPLLLFTHLKSPLQCTMAKVSSILIDAAAKAPSFARRRRREEIARASPHPARKLASRQCLDAPTHTIVSGYSFTVNNPPSTAL